MSTRHRQRERSRRTMWTTSAGVVMVVVMMVMMGGGVRADPFRKDELNILSAAINDTTEKISIYKDEVDTVISNAESVLNSVIRVLSDLTSMNIPTEFNENAAILSAKNRIEAFQETMQTMLGRVADQHTVAKANNQRYKRCWKDVDDLNAQNNLQDARLDGLAEAPPNIMEAVNDQISDLGDEASEKLTSLDEYTDLVENALDRQMCGSIVVDVSVSTNGNGISGSTTVDLSSMLPSDANANVFCGITGIASTINTPNHNGFGYKTTSEREDTSFSVTCSSESIGSVKVEVADSSQSHSNINAISAVSVSVKACTFQGVTNTNLD